jgi:hypothetical protein
MPERTGLGGLKLDTPLPADSVGAKGLLTIAFFVAGAQTAAALKQAAIVGVAGTIVDVRARALTGPTGAALIADVNKNGTTIFSTQGNRPTIADGATVSSTTLPDVTSVAAGRLPLARRRSDRLGRRGAAICSSASRSRSR